MTCKDCLYYEPCSTLNAEFKKHPKDFIDSDLCAKQCTTFKDRSRFVELPCKLGDTVYFVLRSFYGKTRINPEKVCYFTIDDNELRIHTTAGYFTEHDMNGGAFFTREEAERALKERENNG